MQFNILEENKVLIKSFVEEVFNKHNLTAIDKYHATNLTNGSEKNYSLKGTLCRLRLYQTVKK
jgi:hypothetical protein